MAPKISIIISNFNYGRFLRFAIDSGLEQTLQEVEVIVVDDGSTDDSREVVASYGDAIIPVYQANGGQAHAANAGFARSSGDYVIFLDSDDVLLPHTAAAVAGAFAQDERLVKVMYPMEHVDHSGRSMGIIKPEPHLPRRSGDVSYSSLWFPFDTVWMGTSGNAFSSSKVRSLFPIPESDYRLGVDWYLGLISPLLGEVRFLDHPGALHRIHGDNNFERLGADVSLEQVRAAIVFARTTAKYIVAAAEREGFDPRPRDADDVFAVSDIMKRITSKKADTGHPVQDDTLPRLIRLGVRAARRRTDVSIVMRVLYVVWLFVIVTVPARLALKLSSFFSFPARRQLLNGLLRVLHR